jgi:hypothetical protein
MEGKVAYDSAVREEGREVDEQLFTIDQSFPDKDCGSDTRRYADADAGVLGSCSEEVGTPIVKNTFIECCIRTRPVRRRKTLPASWRIGLEPRHNDDMPFDEDCSDLGTCSAPVGSWAFTRPCRIEETGASADIELASNADSLMDTPTVEEATTRKMSIAEHFAEVIQEASNALEVSDLLEGVETSCGAHGCVILLRPSCGADTSTTRILTLAEQSLRDAAAQSKVAYILGYCSPNMTAVSPLGFEITLGAMKNAKLACWHMFKRGVCRHGDRCRWQHPSVKLSVRVIVEVAELEAPRAPEFQLQVAKVVDIVASTLQQNQIVSHANAREDKTSNGWTISVSSSCPSEAHEEELLALAKAAVVGTTIGSQVSLMGYEAQPFVPRARGFTMVLGNRTTARKPCSSMYYWGVCKRGCSCTYEHPSCLVPVQIVTNAE